MNENNDRGLHKSVINWYPGHMKKTKDEITKLNPLIDFVLELVDSRIPYSSKIVGIEKIIKNKPKILVMTKKDLCDKIETGKWIKYYEDLGYKVLNLNLMNQDDCNILIKSIDDLSDKLNEKRTSKGLKAKVMRGLVVGIPNVGKSTLINRLAKKKVAGVGNIPGFTKNLTWLKAGNALLLDSPGILWPKFDNQEVALNLASMSAIRMEVIPVDDVAVHILKKLNAYYNDKMYERFGLSHLSEDYEENYSIIGKKIGAIQKGGYTDYDKISLFIINDIKQEKIKGITFDRR